VPGLNGIVSISAGGNFAIAQNDGGVLAGWGANNVGQLADGTFSPRPTPVRVGGQQTFLHSGAGAFHGVGVIAP
jgi:alpha-tubulin suppressor-like RCC1 family protein